MKKETKLVIAIIAVLIVSAFLYRPSLNLSPSEFAKLDKTGGKYNNIRTPVLGEACRPNSWKCDGNDRVYLGQTCQEEQRITCGEGTSCAGGACVCEPATCETLGNYECGEFDDECGGTVNCGSCIPGFQCVSGTCMEDIQVEPGIWMSTDHAETNEVITFRAAGFPEGEISSQYPTQWYTNPPPNPLQPNSNNIGSGLEVNKSFAYPGNYTVSFEYLSGSDFQIHYLRRNFTVYSPLAVLKSIELTTLTKPQGFVVTNGAAWVGGEVARLAVVDVAPVEDAYLIGDWNHIGAPIDISTNGNIVAVSSAWGGLHFYDAEHPENLTLLGTYDTFSQENQGYAYSSVFANSYLYVVVKNSTSSKIIVLDVSNPSSPVKVGAWSSTIGQFQRIWLDQEANRLVLNAGSTLRFMDLSNPTSPSLVAGSVPVGGYVFDVGIKNRILVSREYNPSQYEIFNITNLSSLQLLYSSSIDDNNGQAALVLNDAGDAFYINYGSSLVHKYSLSNPSSPQFLGLTTCAASKLYFTNGTLYGACSGATVRILGH